MSSSTKVKESRTSVRPGKNGQEKEEDSSSIRETQLYRETLKLLQWQRDNYMVGHDYAEQRKFERQSAIESANEQESMEKTAAQLPKTKGQQQGPLGITTVEQIKPSDQIQIPFDATTLGHQQLVRLAAWFIPTETVQHALVPLVVTLPAGPLKQPIIHGLVDLISGQQHNVDGVVKEQLIHFFSGDGPRKFVKDSANNFISGSFPQSGGRKT